MTDHLIHKKNKTATQEEQNNYINLHAVMDHSWMVFLHKTERLETVDRMIISMENVHQ